MIGKSSGFVETLPAQIQARIQVSTKVLYQHTLCMWLRAHIDTLITSSKKFPWAGQRIEACIAGMSQSQHMPGSGKGALSHCDF